MKAVGWVVGGNGIVRNDNSLVENYLIAFLCTRKLLGYGRRTTDGAPDGGPGEKI